MPIAHALTQSLLIGTALLASSPEPRTAVSVETAPAPFSQTVEMERRPLIMGTITRLVAEGKDRGQALTALGHIEQVLRDAEAELSTWRDDTALSLLNRAPLGRDVALPKTVDAELSRAVACAELTDGAFDPAMGTLTQAWDLRGAGRIPTDDELHLALQSTGRHHLRRADGSASPDWRRLADVRVDEGGFGKGAALDRVQGALAERPAGRVLVDLGGQMLLHDPRPDGEPWTVAVADPDDRSTPVLALQLPRGSVATSANSERAAGPVGHLLDPRSGRPADDFGSVTVWAPDGLTADCLATGLFVAGPDAALALAAARDDVEVVVLERAGDGKLLARVSNGLRDRVETISDRVSLPPHDTPNPKTSASPSPGRPHRPVELDGPRR